MVEERFFCEGADQLVVPQESSRGHAFLRPRLAPTVRHSCATLVQRPLAHASPSAPHVCPLACVLSAGHTADVPVHVSAMSHALSFDGRQTCVAGAKRHVVQHGLESGSHTAFAQNLHVADSQHGESTPTPGSQSSPFSMMPLPQI